MPQPDDILEQELGGASTKPARELSGPAPTQPAPDLLGTPEPAPDTTATADPPASELAGAPDSAVGEPELGAPPPATPPPVEQTTPLPSDRSAAELEELQEIVTSIESLKFLRPRLARSIREGADASILVSFYRLTARTLLDEIKQKETTVEQFRANIHKLRSKVNQAEVQLAVAQAGGSVPRAATQDQPAPTQADTSEFEAHVQQLQAELDKTNEQREKLLNDFKNMRNRAQMDTEIKVFKAKEKLFGSLLPVLDSFLHAVSSLKTSTDIDAVVAGVEMIQGQFLDALRTEGLSEIQAVGQPFDPRFHEACGHVETDEMPDEYVYDQYQPGYMLGERLLRAAMVRVARNAGQSQPGQPPSNQDTSTEPPPEETPEGPGQAPVETGQPPPEQADGPSDGEHASD